MNDDKVKAIAEAEKIIADYPRKELIVSCCQVARDMSVGISNILKNIIPFNEIRKGERLDFPYEILKTPEVTDNRLIIEWVNHETINLELGQDIKIDRGETGSSLTPVTKWLELTFKYVSLEDKMFEILGEISDYHNRITPTNDFITTNQVTAYKEIISLRLMDEAIAQGNAELYVLKAILAASNNWSTGEIVRPSLFREILLEGVEKGCLSPDNEKAWHWLEIAADCNDPSEFMEDMERYYDILATAAEEGNEIALDIMNRIWEPEQIIEED